jgi:tRNA(His) 5'-end guanylyltransferase
MPVFDGDDAFGERMKFFENFETSRLFLPTLPIYARIDGRTFKNFTKGMNRPYDERMSQIMVDTTKYLVEKTHAKIGYTQSDEISLIWKSDDIKSDIFFDGKIQKMVSILASMTTAAFTNFILKSELASYASRMPHFDCRVIQFPNKVEAANMILWRSIDAVKNSISMATQHYYSHKELHGKNGSMKQEMLFQKGVNFNNYPTFFKQGVFVKRFVELKELSEDVAAKLIAMGKTVEPVYCRSVIKEIDMPIFSKVTNRVEVIFNGDDPIIG